MTWVKLDDQFFRNPKVLRAGRDARDLYIAALCFCASQLTDGLIPAKMLRVLEAEADIDGVADAAERLVECGLWERAASGYVVHDFLEYNPSAEQVRANRTVRAEAGRLGGVKSGESRRSHIDEAKGQAIGKQNASVVASPVLEANAKQKRTPYPSPYPLDLASEAVVDHGAPPPLAALLEAFVPAAGRPLRPGEERSIADWTAGKLKHPPPRDVDAFSWAVERAAAEATKPNCIPYAATLAADAPECLSPADLSGYEQFQTADEQEALMRARGPKRPLGRNGVAS